MKITDIKTVRLRAALSKEGQLHSRTGKRMHRSATLVEVHTDEGITGIGSCSGNGTIIEVIIQKVLKPILIGADPCKIEEIWELAYFCVGVSAFGSRGVGVVALSGIDMALWDILGKVKGIPLYELLGATRGKKVELYATALYPEAPERVAEKALDFVDMGFRSMKIKVGFDLDRDIEIVKAVRAALGNDFTIMTDANMGYDREVAVKAAAAFEECSVAFFEEPLFVEDVAGHSFLKTKTKIPIALGENLHTHFAFQQFIERAAVDILQPDIARVGGVSEMKKIDDLAKQYGLPISLHTWGDGVALAASLHLSAALESASIMEFDCKENPMRSELLMEPLKPDNGFMSPPDKPGLGIELNPEALERYAFQGEESISFKQRPLSMR
ncbi:mandelate racemase/muconate lactonizing enzyme family protein [Thermodesulfobacteriota bacterium]